MTTLNSLQLMIQASPYSVAKTMERLETAIKARGMTVFAIIDHAREAEKVEMPLKEEKVIIFGDPKVGTFLMQENPLVGIELPLRILVWLDLQNVVQVAYLDPLSIGQSYAIKHHEERLKKMSLGLDHLVKEALQ
jgi:uncharacterized protein (DUF302 family)